MKKSFFFVTLIWFSFVTHAQLGVQAGLNISTWTGSDADGAKSLTGFHAGANYNIVINRYFSFQPEAIFSTEGVKNETDNEFKMKTNYINIAPMIRYNTSGLGLFLVTGPQLGFLMSAKASDGSTTVDAKESFKTTNFSWTSGAGYEMRNGLGIEARYNLGLSNIIDESGSDVKTNVFQVGLRYNVKMSGLTGKK